MPASRLDPMIRLALPGNAKELIVDGARFPTASKRRTRSDGTRGSCRHDRFPIV